MEVGVIDGNASRTLHPKEINKEMSFALKTKDIDGGWAGTLSDKFLRRNVNQKLYFKMNSSLSPNPPLGKKRI